MKPTRHNGHSIGRLVHYIFSRNLRLRQRLPSIGELADEWNMPLPAVRDAFLQAQIMGLVRVQPNSGSYVLAVNFAPVAEAFSKILLPYLIPHLLQDTTHILGPTPAANNLVLRTHDLEIDTGNRTVKRNGNFIHLTRREYALLRLLAARQGKVVSRPMICEHLYGTKEIASNVVEAYIRLLRRKIDKKSSPSLIVTRYGEGYLLRGEGTET